MGEGNVIKELSHNLFWVKGILMEILSIKKYHKDSARSIFVLDASGSNV